MEILQMKEKLFSMTWNLEIISEPSDFGDEYKHLSRLPVVKFTFGELSFLVLYYPDLKNKLTGENYLEMIRKANENGKSILFCPLDISNLSDFSNYEIIKL